MTVQFHFVLDPFMYACISTTGEKQTQAKIKTKQLSCHFDVPGRNQQLSPAQ